MSIWPSHPILSKIEQAPVVARGTARDELIKARLPDREVARAAELRIPVEEFRKGERFSGERRHLLMQIRREVTAERPDLYRPGLDFLWGQIIQAEEERPAANLSTEDSELVRVAYVLAGILVSKVVVLEQGQGNRLIRTTFDEPCGTTRQWLEDAVRALRGLELERKRLEMDDLNVAAVLRRSYNELLREAKKRHTARRKALTKAGIRVADARVRARKEILECLRAPACLVVRSQFLPVDDDEVLEIVMTEAESVLDHGQERQASEAATEIASRVLLALQRTRGDEPDRGLAPLSEHAIEQAAREYQGEPSRYFPRKGDDPMSQEVMGPWEIAMTAFQEELSRRGI